MSVHLSIQISGPNVNTPEVSDKRNRGSRPHLFGADLACSIRSRNVFPFSSRRGTDPSEFQVSHPDALLRHGARISTEWPREVSARHRNFEWSRCGTFAVISPRCHIRRDRQASRYRNSWRQRSTPGRDITRNFLLLPLTRSAALVAKLCCNENHRAGQRTSGRLCLGRRHQFIYQPRAKQSVKPAVSALRRRRRRTLHPSFGQAPHARRPASPPRRSPVRPRSFPPSMPSSITCAPAPSLSLVPSKLC